MDKSEVLQGTLDLMILKTLQALGSLHGFGTARRIEQLSEDVLTLNEGAVYTSLLRLQQKSWIASEWGVSENNGRARFLSAKNRDERSLFLFERSRCDWYRDGCMSTSNSGTNASISLINISKTKVQRRRRGDNCNQDD